MTTKVNIKSILRQKKFRGQSEIYVQNSESFVHLNYPHQSLMLLLPFFSCSQYLAKPHVLLGYVVIYLSVFSNVRKLGCQLCKRNPIGMKKET